MDIGTLIKDERERQNISMNKLAKMANVGQSTLSYIESGERQPTFDVLERIVLALGFSLADFFAEDKPELAPDIRRLIQAAERLTPEQRELVQKLVESIGE